MSVKAAAGILLAVCLLAAPLRAADVDRLLPDDSSVVISVDVKLLLDSALVKKHGLAPVEKAFKSNGNVDKFLTAAGFDPFQDLTRVTFALEGDLSKANGLMILRGKFDTSRIAARAEALAQKDERIQIESIAGQTVYRWKGPDGLGHLAILDASTAILAPDKRSVEAALAKQAGKHKLALNKDMQRQIEGMELGRGVWMVANGAALRKTPLAADDKVKEVFDHIQFVTVTVAVTDGVAVKALVTATSDDDAKALHKDIEGGVETAKGVLAVVGDNRPELAPVAELLETLKLKGEGSTLRLDLAASARIIEKMMNARK